jgi:hypothetical protein
MVMRETQMGPEMFVVSFHISTADHCIYSKAFVTPISNKPGILVAQKWTNAAQTPTQFQVMVFWVLMPCSGVVGYQFLKNIWCDDGNCIYNFYVSHRSQIYMHKLCFLCNHTRKKLIEMILKYRGPPLLIH